MVDWECSLRDVHAYYSLWWNRWSRHSCYGRETADWYARDDERIARSIWRKYVMQERTCNVQRDAVRDMRKRPVEYAEQVAGAMAVQPVSTPRKHGCRSANKMGSSRAVQQVREHQ